VYRVLIYTYMNLYKVATYKVNILIKHQVLEGQPLKSFKLLGLKYSTSKLKHPIAFLAISIIINLVSSAPYPHTTKMSSYFAISNIVCLSSLMSLFKRIARL